MRADRIITLTIWTCWPAFIAASMLYLGANTDDYRDRMWPPAGLTGAFLGGMGGLTSLEMWGNRRGMLLISIPFGLVLGVVASLFWAGK